MGRSVPWRTLGDFWRLVVVSTGRGTRHPGIETRDATQPLRCAGRPVLQPTCPWCQGLGGPALGSGSRRGSLLGPLTVLRWAAQGLAWTGCWWEEAARTQRLGGPGSLGTSRA